MTLTEEAREDLKEEKNKQPIIEIGFIFKWIYNLIKKMGMRKEDGK